MMMTPHAIPKLIKPKVLAKDGQTLTGALPLCLFPRLADHLASEHGEVQVSLIATPLTKAYTAVDLRITGCIPLICQRCLEAYEQSIDVFAKLCPIPEEDEAEDIPDDYEPVILEQGNLNIYSMIEDELLLSLPTIPCHPLEDCPAKDKVVQDGEDVKNHSHHLGDFAIIRNLK